MKHAGHAPFPKDNLHRLLPALMNSPTSPAHAHLPIVFNCNGSRLLTVREAPTPPLYTSTHPRHSSAHLARTQPSSPLSPSFPLRHLRVSPIDMNSTQPRAGTVTNDRATLRAETPYQQLRYVPVERNCMEYIHKDLGFSTLRRENSTTDYSFRLNAYGPRHTHSTACAFARCRVSTTAPVRDYGATGESHLARLMYMYM